jgi:hypothetical protein
MVVGGGGWWRDLDLRGGISLTGGDIAVVAGVGGGVDNCHPKWRTA